jgi:hypothetical protein
MHHSNYQRLMSLLVAKCGATSSTPKHAHAKLCVQPILLQGRADSLVCVDAAVHLCPAAKEACGNVAVLGHLEDDLVATAEHQ